MTASTGARSSVLVIVGMLLPLAIAALALRFLWPAPPPLSPSRAATDSSAATPDARDRTPEIFGKVVDASGNVVRGANVRLVYPRPPFTVVRDLSSDMGGAFSFAHLDPGPVLIVADHEPEGFVTGEALEVAAGKSQEVTLGLSASSGVRGTVVDEADRPVSNVSVSIAGVPWRLPTATTDESGSFHLVIVPDQASALVAVARGYKAATSPFEGRVRGTELVVRLRLSAGASVQGEVLGPDGEPLHGARIVACAGQAAEVAATSGDEGAFELPPKSIGCDAIAQLTGYAASEPTRVVEGARLHIRLRAGGAVEGVVVDDRGSGVPAFSVGIESFVSAKSTTSFGSFMQPRYDRGPRAFEDIRGEFRWEKLLPGDYVLTASVKGRPPARSATIQVQSGSVTRGVRIVVAVGGTVMGRIVDDHGDPQADVEIAFDSVSSIVASNLSARSDESGRYRLDGAPAGPFTLRAAKNGFRTRMVAGLRVASGATLSQDLQLSPDDGKGSLELGGVGATLSVSPEGIIVANVGPDDPAAQAGIQAGDRIVSIDGESSEGMSLADAVQRLRGEAGTNVGVSVERSVTRQIIDVVVVRRMIVR